MRALQEALVAVEAQPYSLYQYEPYSVELNGFLRALTLISHVKCTFDFLVAVFVFFGAVDQVLRILVKGLITAAGGWAKRYSNKYFSLTN